MTFVFQKEKEKENYHFFKKGNKLKQLLTMIVIIIINGDILMLILCKINSFRET